MRPPHQPNANPLVERIVQAYLKTHLSDAQFEALVEELFVEAKKSSGEGDTVQAYDKGFSDGYDSATKDQS
jgi:hypothetical protein